MRFEDLIGVGHHAVWRIGSKFSEEPAVSIFRVEELTSYSIKLPEDEGLRFLRNVGTSSALKTDEIYCLVELYVSIADHHTKQSKRRRALFSGLQHRVDLKEPDVSGGIYRLRLGA
jgi:hypothetical protein